jgi:hypothetical protein
MARNLSLQVSEQERDRQVRVATVRVGDKTLATPCFATWIQNQSELDLLLKLKTDYEPLRLGAFVIRFFDAPTILRKVQPSVKTDILGRVREDKYSVFMRENVFLTDPVTEYLYYDVRMDGFFVNPYTPKDVIDHLYRLKRERAYKDTKTSYGKRRDKLHTEFWKHISEDTQAKIKFVKSLIEFQMACGVDIVIPPTPLIHSKEMFEIANDINNISKEITRGRRLCASYFLMKNTILKSDSLMNEVKLSIMENSSKSFTVLKFKNLDLTNPAMIVERDNYRELMLDLASLNQTSHDRVCMVLENSYQAFVSPFAGFDLVSSSFTFYDHDISYSEHPPYGKYLDPVWKVHRTFDDMVDVYRNYGRLPCHCRACKEVKLRDLALMTPENWNMLRRVHIPLLMDGWMEYVARAAKERNTELARDSFANSKISILKDLLP